MRLSPVAQRQSKRLLTARSLVRIRPGEPMILKFKEVLKMNFVELDVEERSELRKNRVKKLRQAQYVPATIYGGDKDCIQVKVKENLLQKVYKTGNKTNTLLKLNLSNGTESVVSYQVEVDAITNRYVHVDFLRVEEKKPVKLTVPIKLSGQAPGLKKGGILIQKLRKLKISCLPSQIPEFLDISISALEIDEFIKIKNIRDQFDFDILNTDHDSIVRIASSRVSQAEDEAEAATTTESSAEAVPAS
eukprot:COSAG01_NODE_662_length_14431_cov_31.385775_15_plen_247_part_00